MGGTRKKCVGDTEMHRVAVIVAAVALLAVIVVAAAHRGRNGREGFDAYLSVLHVTSADRLVIAVDPRDTNSRTELASISSVSGVELVDSAIGGGDEARLDTLYSTDVLSVKGSNDLVAAIVPGPPKSFFLLGPFSANAPRTLQQLAARRHVVRFGDDVELSILNVACLANDMVVDALRTERFRGDVARSLSLQQDDEEVYPVYAVWAAEGSDLVAACAEQKVVVVGYDGSAAYADAHRFRMYAADAFLSRGDRNVLEFFPKASISPGTGRVTSVITSPVVLAGDPAIERSPLLPRVVAALLSTETGQNSALHLADAPMFEVTRTLLGSANAEIAASLNGISDLAVGIPERPVLEQFEGPKDDVRMSPTKNVRGFAEADGVFRLTGSRLDGVLLRAGDRVRLTRQDRAAENGDYVVIEHEEGPILLVTRYPIDPSPDTFSFLYEEDDGRFRFSVSTSGSGAPEGVSPAEGDRVLWNILPDGTGTGTGTVTFAGPSTFEVLMDAPTPRDYEKFHPLSICSSDAAVPVKELCEERGGTWDRPCERDADCPFFQKNRTYLNYRGGCLGSGFCELPLGVERVGYRHSSGAPLCHSGPSCADSDLAFPMDEFERRPETKT